MKTIRSRLGCALSLQCPGRIPRRCDSVTLAKKATGDGLSSWARTAQKGQADVTRMRSWRINSLRLARLPLLLLTILIMSGCTSRPRGWGFPGGLGTMDRQKSRAAVHDPYPFNDIGPPVVGGRPREFSTPRSEATREANIPRQYRNLPPQY
jgi:hypothetical protein